MPRGVKKPSNQHNSRHENGVVAPGKRITRQKSNGHLNGSAEGPSLPNGVPHPASAHTTSRLPDRRTAGTVSTARTGSHAGESHGGRSAENSKEVLEVLPNGVNHVNGPAEHTHRKIDVNAAKNPLVHDNSIWHLALTILRSCPLGDTIAILIFLLSLPPTLLTVTNALFAVLTFITPTGASSLPTTFHEIFQGSGGTPSLATIFLTDVIGLTLWLVMWTPMQSLSIELAQAVVATTLGGGTASKKKGSDRTLLCMSLVTVSHVARNQWIPNRLFGYDWSAILSSIPYVSKSPSYFSGYDFIPTRSPGGWFRILIALHILVQGLVHVARRWYQKREYSQALSVSKKTDPEAIAGSAVRPTPLAPSEAGGLSAAIIPDATPKTLSTNAKETRDRVSSGKKKRKQGTYVRSQQPLWAAFAHTKVTVLREYEQSHIQSEIIGSGATDTRNLGNAPFENEDGCVWISHVMPTSFRFDTSYLSNPQPEELGPEKSIVSANIGIDRSKPLYVRINDTDWTSTAIEKSSVKGKGADGQWSGEVFGLSPSSSYKCSFVQSEDGVEIHSAIVTTPPSLTTEKGSRNVLLHNRNAGSHEADPTQSSIAPPQRAHRPSSPKTPSTTLKESISAFEASLSDSQARQKRNKKDSKTAFTNLKKDIDVFNSRIAKLGGEDKAHLNRHLQWNQHTKQADDAVNNISDEIESLGCLPEDDVRLSKEGKANWDEARNQQSVTREALFRSKDSAHRERSSAQSEAISTQQKRERLSGRKIKLNDQHEKLQSATSQGLDEKERKNSEQAAKDLERLQLEQRSHEQITSFQRAVQDSRCLIQQTWQQAQIIENALYEQQMIGDANVERPITPEGDLPGTVPHNAIAPTVRYSTFGSPDPPNGIRSHSGSLRHNDHRPRSTSMLSGNSVYADFDDEDPAPPMPARAVEVIRGRGRKHSLGSGSGSSGSQRDPASPLVGNLSQTSPVGKRSPVWN